MVNVKLSLSLLLVVFFATVPMAASSQGSECEVPWRDERGTDRDVVEAMAAAASEDGQVMILYSPTNEIWDQSVKGACRSMQATEVKLHGFLLASGDERELAFYANRQLTETVLSPDASTLATTVAASLARDYERWIKGQ